MLGLGEFIISKDTGEFKSTTSGSKKQQVLYMTEELLVIKEAGYSGYVHRGIGLVYTPACISTFRIKKIINYKKTIRIYSTPIESTEVNKLDEYIKDKIKFISDTYPEKEYNHFTNDKDKEIFERSQQHYKELMEACDNVKKHGDEENE